jgi:hypothetical protein
MLTVCPPRSTSVAQLMSAFLGIPSSDQTESANCVFDVLADYLPSAIGLRLSLPLSNSGSRPPSLFVPSRSLPSSPLAFPHTVSLPPDELHQTNVRNCPDHAPRLQIASCAANPFPSTRHIISCRACPLNTTTLLGDLHRLTGLPTSQFLNAWVSIAWPSQRLGKRRASEHKKPVSLVSALVSAR